MADALAHWPGAERRDPPISSPTWVVRHALARWLRAQAAELEAGDPVRILDVGCGVKPYYPFFAHVASEYVGVDVVENPAAELLGPVEALPVEDASFDVVLCTQVLEHSDDPAQAVRELRRVTRAGGRVLASTHGVQVYHPSPVDYWRWTHEGLRRLFDQNGPWAELAVEPAAGTGSALAMLLGDVRRDRAPPHVPRPPAGAAAEQARRLPRRAVRAATRPGSRLADPEPARRRSALEA